jgi:biopolymer transport protein TolR
MRSEPAIPFADMNVTPFIDVLLVLLVIFMMLNLYGRTSIRAQVPPESLGPAIGHSQLVLELPATGAFALNGQPIPADQLETQLRAIFTDRSPSLLFVTAAPTRKYQEVIEAMDAARGAGVQLVALMPSPTEGVK